MKRFQENFQRKDGQTLIQRTLTATAGDPIREKVN